jgi:hypothetical protein
MSLYLKPPVIDPKDYLTAAEAAKTAAVRLTSPPGYWDDEIRQTLLREHPYIPADRAIVNFSQRDDATGTAMGYVSIAGCPTISIPVIIKNRELAPLDIIIIRQGSPAGESLDQQGSGDMTDDEVKPLDEQTFHNAIDAGSIGDVVPPHATTGTAYTEDASALRLPFRGRTVIASIVGVTEAQKDALGLLISKNSQYGAGFVINKTAAVVDEWLSAKAPTSTFHMKIASQPIKLTEAIVLAETPDELKTSDFLAADVYVDDETCKTAIVFEAISLSKPEAGKARWLAFEDGSYCRAPEKVAGVLHTGEAESKVVTELMAKISAPSLRLGQTIVLHVDGIFTAPAKIASIQPREDQKNIHISLTDDFGAKFSVVLDRRIKHATFEESTQTWVLPVTARVLVLGDHAQVLPLAPAKVAAALERQLTDQLVYSNGQYSLSVRGASLGTNQVGEEKMSKILGAYLSNGPQMIEMVKEASKASNNGTGIIRFGSDIPDLAAHIEKMAGYYHGLSGVLDVAVKDISLPLDKAVKLAASIGDPDGVDAVLGAGFLSEDNLAEFVGLADQFSSTVSKLARLLLAIRMGFPGDETATVVAMKSLSRVAERLQSAGQEV